MTNYRRRRKPNRDTTPKMRVNEQIRHPEIRVVHDEDGLIGIMSPKEALKIAEERELDLVELNPKANPPVVKMMNYNKFKYLKSKSEPKKQADKIKTVRVSVRIGPHDLDFQARKVDQFLEKGFKVKTQVQMKGREKAHPEVAEEVLYLFLNRITNPFKYIQEPKKISDSYFATLQPQNAK